MRVIVRLSICCSMLLFQSSLASRFMTSLQVELGFSSATIGIIIGVMNVAMSLASPFVTSISDSKKIHRLMLSLQTIAKAMPLVGMWVLYDSHHLHLTQYWILSGVISVLGSGVTANMNSLIISKLVDESAFGTVRMWGALWYGIGNLFVGCLIYAFNSFAPMFACAIAALFFAIPSVFWALPAYAGNVGTPVRTENTVVTFSALKEMLIGTKSRSIFFTNCIMLGACLSLVESLLFAAMSKFMDGTNTIIEGASVLVSVLFEIPLFYMAPTLIKKFGTKKMILVANLAFICRGTGYAIFNQAWVALVLEMFHGISFGLFYSAAVEICTVQAPTGYEATMQSLIDATFYGIGLAIGAIGGGFMLDYVGNAYTFAVFVVALAFVSVLFFLIFQETHNTPNNTSENTSNTGAPYVLHPHNFTVPSLVPLQKLSSCDTDEFEEYTSPKNRGNNGEFLQPP